MVFTSEYPLYVDGVRLDTLAYNIETLDGRYNLPEVRAEDFILPGRDGVVPNWSEDFTHTDYVLNMWVRDTDPDGEIPEHSNSRDQFEKNLAALMRLFAVRHRPLRLRRKKGDGTFEIADARVIAAVTPKVEAPLFASMKVVLEIFNTFWRDENPIVFQTNLSSTNQTVVVNGFKNTFPIKDAKITLRGPCASPITITDVASGAWISLPRSLNNTESWIIDCAAGTSKVGLNHFRPRRSLDHNMFVMNADHSGDQNVTTQVRLKVSSGSNIKVEGRRNLL